MTETGLTNVFADRPGSWHCVTAADIVQADPDVMIIGYYRDDPAFPKIDYLHNNSLLCKMNAVIHADYIGVPFSASTLGPRNGAATVDIAGAVIHVRTGENTINLGQSGVDFFVCHLGLVPLRPQAARRRLSRCASRWTGPRGAGSPHCEPPVPRGSGQSQVRQDILHQLWRPEHADQNP